MVTTVDHVRLAPSAGSGFRRDIQGLRALAVLLVVFYHAGWGFSGGFVGVDVFFVVSGFVITGMLLREFDSSGSIRLRLFYARRARRLLPALALLLVVVLVASTWILSPFGQQQWAARTAAAACAFVANLYLYTSLAGYFAPAAETNPFLHLWTLSVEEQFYLVLPAVLLVALRVRARVAPLRSSRLAVGVVMGALSFGSLALCWSLTSGHRPIPVADPRRFAFFSTLTRMWEFGGGVLLAVAGRRLAAIGDRTGLVAGLLGGALVLWASLRFDADTAFPGIAALLPVGGTVLLIVAGAASAQVARPLEWRPLTWLGDRSYSWYLWHWPCIVFARVLWPGNSPVVTAAALLSLVPAVLAYQLVERPLRERRSVIGWRAVRLTAACLAVPLLVGGAVAVRSGAVRAEETASAAAHPHREGGLPDPAQLAERTAAIRAGCLGDPGGPEWPASDCTFGAASGEGTVLLLGDSKAAALADVTTEAASAAHRRTAVWTRAACPFLVPSSYVPHDCADWEAAAFQLVDELDPDLVVLSNRTPNDTTEDDFDYWAAQLDATLDRLDEMGVPALLVSDSPELPAEPVQALTSASHAVVVLPASEARAQLEPMLTRERAVVEGHPGDSVVDTMPSVCDPDCRSAGDGEWWYFDALHFTPRGAARLIDPITAGVAGLLD